MEQVTEGAPADVPSSERVAPALHAAILRGLHEDPAARWPSMADLVRELEHAIARMQLGLVGRPPLRAAMLQLSYLVLTLGWLALELAGIVPYTARGWWVVSTAQLVVLGLALAIWHGRLEAAFKTPRMALLPVIVLPLLLGHRVIAWASDSSLELMFAYDYLLFAGIAWGATLIVERKMWPLVVLGLSMMMLALLEPSWAPRLWLGMLLGPPVVGSLVIARGKQ